MRQLEVIWYDGELSPPESPVEGLELPNEGALILGDRGALLHNFRTGEIRLNPDDRFPEEDWPEPTMDRPMSHYVEWTEACKGRGKTLSNFQYGARLTETILAGIVAYRLGKPLDWNGPEMRADNLPEAETLIRPSTRSDFLSSPPSSDGRPLADKE